VDPRAVLQPVGSRPPYVYWVRRLALIVVLIVLVVLAAHACSGGGSSDRDAALGQRADQHPVTSSSASPGTSATPTASEPIRSCRAQDLTVSASADATTYPRGVEPRFTAVVRNTGSACRFPTALSSRTWRILSGSYRVWSTADCRRSPAGRPVTLKPGAQVAYVLRWDRFGSVPGCASAGPKAQPGTYRLYVTIDGASAPAAVFVLAD
jgi:hypothetical protein